MSDSENDAGSEGPQINEEDLIKELEDKCQEAFNTFDRNDRGEIESSDAKEVLRIMGVEMEEDDIFRLLSDIDPENSGIISYADFKSRILERELTKLRGSDDNELMDAYVAMGGDEDGGGCVDAKKLIQTIKEDF